ncbi:MAG: N-succinylarginine dihydrolase [Rubripirellula sp.]
MNLVEAQVDRLVGPTHHFGGLGVGNLASQQHAGDVSNPAAAALQGLDKMRSVARLGVPQFVLPPQQRPNLGLLRALGFSGSDADVLKATWADSPHLLSAATSCSAMWTANAGTVTPSVDSGAGCVTIANLSASLHRSIEPAATMADLQRLLPTAFVLRPPLPGGAAVRDEGAANHMRLGNGESAPGIHLFVYGDEDPKPSLHWPRQSLAACQAIARAHGLSHENTFYLKQHPAAIDAGAFHNDVVALSHDRLFIHHELAFHGGKETLERIESRFLELTGTALNRMEVSSAVVSLEDAVGTYLFNSQVVMPAGERRPVIFCPTHVRQHQGTRGLVREWCQRGIFREAQYVALDQSMSGGGGPACLRLRVPVTEAELGSMPTKLRWTEGLDQALRMAIDTFYVKELRLENLADAEFVDQTRIAQEKILEILG